MSASQRKRLEEQRNEMLEVVGVASVEGDLFIVQMAIEALKETAHEVSYDSKVADTYVAARAGYAFERICAHIRKESQ